MRLESLAQLVSMHAKDGAAAAAAEDEQFKVGGTKEDNDFQGLRSTMRRHERPQPARSTSWRRLICPRAIFEVSF